jgi:hypothetical protein
MVLETTPMDRLRRTAGVLPVAQAPARLETADGSEFRSDFRFNRAFWKVLAVDAAASPR